MGEDHPIKIDTSNGDITLKAITGNSSQSVATSINDLYSKVSGVTSDARKKNITGDNTAGLKEINALEVKNFTYKDDKEKTPHVGVIAQQLQKIFPNSVFEDSEGFLKIKTEEIFYGMVNAIKELYAQLQDLTAKITGLDKRIEALEKENKQLKEQNNAFEKRLKKLEAKSK
jgi:FtsZ-binding cell division protein ZapB